MSENKKKSNNGVRLALLSVSVAIMLLMAYGDVIIDGLGGALNAVFGFFGYLLFSIVFLINLFELIVSKKSVRVAPIIYLILAIASFSLFMQAVLSKSIDGSYLMAETTFSEYMELCTDGSFYSFGGVICGAAVKALYDFLGTFGCYSVLVLLLISSIYLFINCIATGKLLKDRKSLPEKNKEERVSGDVVEDEFLVYSEKKKGKKNKSSKSGDESLFDSEVREERAAVYSGSDGKNTVNERSVRETRKPSVIKSDRSTREDGGRSVFYEEKRDNADTEGKDKAIGGKPTDIPKEPYTRAYETEKVSFYSADTSIPTAPRTEFPEDTRDINPPKIVHEAKGRRGVDIFENEYARRTTAATDSSMRSAMDFSSDKTATKKRPSEPLHRDLLGYKTDMSEDPNLPPIINADKWSGSLPKVEDEKPMPIFRMNKYGFLEQVNPDGTKIEKPDLREAIINADEVMEQRNNRGTTSSDYGRSSDREVIYREEQPQVKLHDLNSDNSVQNRDNASDLSDKTRDLIISSIDDLRKMKENFSVDETLDENYYEHDYEDEYFDQDEPVQSDLKLVLDEAKPSNIGKTVSITEERTDFGGKYEGSAVQMKVSEKSSGLFIERVEPYVPYKAPPLGLLAKSKSSGVDELLREDLEDTGSQLVQTLKEYNIRAAVKNIICGPSAALYEMELAAGISIKKVISIGDDLARNISAAGAIRIIPHIFGKNCFGLEVPLSKDKCQTVYLRDILESEQSRNSKGDLNFALGIDIEGKYVVPDLVNMPHLLIGGSTGSGKSVLLNSIIISMLYKYSPEQLRFILVDPKRVEFVIYSGMPHMLIPEPINDADKALNAFSWLCDEMNRRYDVLSEAGVKTIDQYNKLIDKNKFHPMSRIVLIVDELNELMSRHKAELEDKIKSLTQLARASGIHLILATQRPSVDVITGVIKSNLPTRVALKVTNYADSRTIIDNVGAEKLVQKGEMLFMEGSLRRIQGPLVLDDEIEKVISYIAENNATIFDYDVAKIINTEKKKDKSNEASDEEDDIISSREKDPYYVKALKLLVESGTASISMIQRNFNIGFNRANRIFGAMEAKGYIGKQEQNKPRQVLLTREKFNELYGREYGEI